MKYLLSALFLLSLPVFVHGQQNHVPNGSFEDHNACSIMDINDPLGSMCVSWYSFTNTTSDYYNACATTTGVDVPLNSLGYQEPHHGSAYAGLSNSFSYSEYIACDIHALQPGLRYQLSFSVSLADTSLYGTDALGAFLFANGPKKRDKNDVFYPHLRFASYGTLTNSKTWVRLSKSFVADSAYSHLVIGPFGDTTLPYPYFNFDTCNALGGYSTAYYYIDSVTIHVLDSFYASTYDTLLCAGDSFTVQYVAPGIYDSNNLFVVQLSDDGGNFAIPVNVGTKKSNVSGSINCYIPGGIKTGSNYRIRMISTLHRDTSAILNYSLKIANPAAIKIVTGSNSPICSGDTLMLYISNAGSEISYHWDGPGGYKSDSANTYVVGAKTSGNYYVSARLYGCEINDTVGVTIMHSPDKPQAESNAPCEGADMILKSSTGAPGTFYFWKGPGNFYSESQNCIVHQSSISMSGYYELSHILNGCKMTDTIFVEIGTLPTPVIISSNAALKTGDNLKLSLSGYNSKYNYLWTGPGGFTSRDPEPEIIDVTALNQGWYIVTIDNSLCRAKDSLYIAIHSDNKLELYPNPNNGKIILKGEMDKDQIFALGVYNVLGQEIYNSKVKTINSVVHEEIILYGISPGVYIMRLHFASENISLRFVVH